MWFEGLTSRSVKLVSITQSLRRNNMTIVKPQTKSISLFFTPTQTPTDANTLVQEIQGWLCIAFDLLGLQCYKMYNCNINTIVFIHNYMSYIYILYTIVSSVAMAMTQNASSHITSATRKHKNKWNIGELKVRQICSHTRQTGKMCFFKMSVEKHLGKTNNMFFKSNSRVYSFRDGSQSKFCFDPWGCV